MNMNIDFLNQWMRLFARSKSKDIKQLRLDIPGLSDGISFYYNKKQWFMFCGSLEWFINNLEVLELKIKDLKHKPSYKIATKKHIGFSSIIPSTIGTTGCSGNNVICFVTDCNIKNLEIIINNWEILNKKHVVLFFLNTKKALHWSLKPCLMRGFINQRNLKRALHSMYKAGCEGIEVI